MIKVPAVHLLEASAGGPPSDDGPAGVDAGVFAAITAAEERLVGVAATAETEVSAAADQLRQAVLALGLGHAALGREHRTALAARLYWGHPNVAVGDIVSAFGLGNQSRLLATIGPISAGVACRACGKPLQATSRSRLSEIRRGRVRSFQDPLSCDGCRQAAAQAEALAEEERYRRRVDDHDWGQPEGANWDDPLEPPETAGRRSGGLRVIS